MDSFGCNGNIPVSNRGGGSERVCLHGYYAYIMLLLFLLGEFGVVYRGLLSGWQGRATAELVAIKTLKGNCY